MKYDIYLTGEVGYSISAEYVKGMLAKLEGKECNVYLSSLGGDVNTALRIYQMFKEHGNVIVHIYGMTASAATIIAMGAKEIVMSEFALFLVHCSSIFNLDWGSYNASQISEKISELEAKKATLETVDEVIASIYALRIGGEVKDMATLMGEEKWLTAAQVKEIGLIDRIDKEKGEKASEISPQIAARISAIGLPLPVKDDEGEKKPIPTPDNDKDKPTPTPVKDNGNGKDTPAAEEKKKSLLERISAALGLSSSSSSTDIPKDGGEEIEELRAQLAERDKEIKELENNCEKLLARIEEINGKDGDSSSSVEPQGGNPQEESFTARAAFQRVKRYL